MMNPIKMVDLKGQYLKIKEEADAAIHQVLNRTNFINGEEVGEFAEMLSRYLHVPHVIPCANGTDALQLALMALDLPKDTEILVPTFNYIAAAEVIALLGFKAIFIEANEDFFNLDTNTLEASITPSTRVIIAVHLYGQACNMLQILKIAQKYNLYVIEDNAQSIGCDYTFPDTIRKKTGTMGHIGTTSFFPSKNLGCMGDGGAVFTHDDALASKIKMISNHGQSIKYFHDVIGINSRLDTLQATILKIKLRYLDEYIQARQLAAAFYNRKLMSVDGLRLPSSASYSTHVYHQYTLRITNGKRDQLKKHLDNLEIPNMIYYPIPLHQQKAFPTSDQKYPVAEQLSTEVLSLPMHTELDNEQLDHICAAIIQFMS